MRTCVWCGPQYLNFLCVNPNNLFRRSALICLSQTSLFMCAPQFHLRPAFLPDNTLFLLRESGHKRIIVLKDEVANGFKSRITWKERIPSGISDRRDPSLSNRPSTGWILCTDNVITSSVASVSGRVSECHLDHSWSCLGAGDQTEYLHCQLHQLGMNYLTGKFLNTLCQYTPRLWRATGYLWQGAADIVTATVM